MSPWSSAVFFTCDDFSPAKYSRANFSQASISRRDSSLTSVLSRELELEWKGVYVELIIARSKPYLECPPTVLAEPLVLEFELFLELSVEQDES